MKYVLLSRIQPYELTNEVNSRLEKGWKLKGETFSCVNGYYYQTMIYEDVKTPSVDVESLVNKIVEALKPRQRHFSIQ